MIVSFARKPDFSALKEESDTVNDVSHYFIDTLICNRILILYSNAGKVALQSYQAHKFWYELLHPLKSYFSFAPKDQVLHRFSFSSNK